MSKEFNLDAYIATLEKVEYKDPEYVMLPECFKEATGFPGIPLGHSTMVYGLSDSGKTNLMLKVAAEAQKQGILPIIVITENKLEQSRAEEMGLNLKHCIIEENIRTLEEVYDYISMKISDIKNGKLPYRAMIFWDSVASTPSKESFEIDKEGRIKKKYGPQKNASVIGYYNPIIMNMVTSTRRKDSENSVGLFLVNQAYVKPPEFPGGMATTVPNGGEKIWYPLSLAMEMKEGKVLKTVHEGRDLEFGLVSKIKVKKNHINELKQSGEVVFAGSEMFANDENLIKEYKANNKQRWSVEEEE